MIRKTEAIKLLKKAYKQNYSEIINSSLLCKLIDLYESGEYEEEALKLIKEYFDEF